MESVILIDILKGVRLIGNLYLFLLFLVAIMNLLGMFGLINIFSGGPMSSVYMVLRRIVDPLLNMINRFVPNMGGLDLGFLILVILLWIVTDLADYYIRVLSASLFSF